MKKLFNATLLLIWIVISLSCNSEDSGSDVTIPELVTARTHLDVSYGTDSKQTYDIYLPENRTPGTKVLVLIHGGNWTSGDKASMNYFIAMIQQDLPGMAIINFNYKLADETHLPFPMQLNDISAMLTLVKNNKDEYIISEDFGFIGVSAGGHLSMLWDYAYDTENNVHMVGSIVGPTNLTDEIFTSNPSPELEPFFSLFTALFGEEALTDYLETYSPYHQVTASASPTALFYGGQDPLVPVSQGVQLSDRLTELGVPHQYTLYEDEAHGWTGGNAIDTWEKLKTFIELHLN